MTPRLFFNPYSVIILLLLSTISLTNISVSDQNDEWIIVERGVNFIRRQNNINPDIFSWESAPQWVYNGINYVSYIYTETDNYYQVQSAFIGARIYKSGYAEFYSPDMTEVRLYEETWSLEYYDKNKWKVCDVYSPTYTIDSDDTSINITASFITDYPNSGERVFDVKYIFREGLPLKHEIVFTSHSTEEYLFRVKQKWAGIVGDKVKHSEGINNINNSTIINSSYFIFEKSDGSLSIFENQYKMYPEYLMPVEIDIHAQGLKANFVFGNWTLSQYESLIIDPDTSTLNNPIEDGYVTWDGIDHVRDSISAEIIFGGEGEAGDWIQDYRGYVEWDISSLAGATLTANPIFKYEGQDTSATDEEINPITEEQPSDAGCTDAELYGYIATGTAYVNPFNLVVNVNQQEDLLADAKTDLQYAMDVSRSWFAVGFQSPSDEGELNNILLSIIGAEDNAPTPPPTLYVEYTTEPANTVKYYFDSWTVQWANNPNNMVDGSTITFADAADVDSQENDGNTCPGNDLGTITKVELRFHAYASAIPDPGVFINLIPYFEGADLGDDHSEVLTTSAFWSAYFDITSDTNAPSPWTWGDVVNLDVLVISGDSVVTYYCSKVEIRVTYTGVPPNTAPTQINHKIWNETTHVEKSLNAIDVDLYPTSFNVTINDADGDLMNITILTNESGIWTVVNQTTTGLINGSYNFTNTSWIDSITKYWISFNVTDSEDWINKTFNFTTSKNIYNVYTGTNIRLYSPPQRKLVRQSNGTLWCTYIENNDIHVAWSEDNGSTWTNREVYGAEMCLYSSLCVDSNDTIHLVFNSRKNDPDDYQLEYSNSTDWTTIVQIRDEDKDHMMHALAVDSNDDLHIAYQKDEEGGSNGLQIAYINSMNNGGSWGTEKILTNEVDAGDSMLNPSLTIDNNNVLNIIFSATDHHAGKDDILHISSSDYGAIWSGWEADPVYQDGAHDQNNPSAVIDDENVLYVIWHGVDQNTNNQIGYSFNDSTGWKAVEWITWDPTLDYEIGTIGINDNNYVHTAYSASFTMINHSVNDTTSWTEDTSVIGNYFVPNMISTQHPTINGLKTNRPKTGYAFISANSTNVVYRYSDDLTWDTLATDTVTITRVSYSPTNIRINDTSYIDILFNITTNITPINQSSLLYVHTVNQTGVHYCHNFTYRMLRDSVELRSMNRNEDLWFEKFNSLTGTGEIGDFGEWGAHHNDSVKFNVVNYGINWTTVRFDAATTIVPHLFSNIWYIDRVDMQNNASSIFDIYGNIAYKTKFNMTNTEFYDSNHYNGSLYQFYYNSNDTGAPGKPLKIYLANESYISGKPSTSDYAVLIGEHYDNDIADYSIRNSSYWGINFSTNKAGFVGTLKMTDLFYFIFVTKAGSPFNKYDIAFCDTNTSNRDFNNSQFTEVSGNGGSSWSTQNGTIDCHLKYAKLDNSSRIEYKVYANDTSGNEAWSTLYTDLIDIVNVAPNPADILTQNGTITDYTVGDIVNITYKWAGDPNQDVCWINTTCHNETHVIIAYIQNRSITHAEVEVNSTWYIDWDTIDVTPGDYYHINITITDPYDLFTGSSSNGTFNLSEALLNTSVDTIIPYVVSSYPLIVTATGPAAIDNVTLWYRYSDDNATWGSNVSYEIDFSSPWSWDFNFSNGTGYYEFYSIGREDGNVEAPPDTFDAICFFGWGNFIGQVQSILYGVMNVNTITPFIGFAFVLSSIFLYCISQKNNNCSLCRIFKKRR